MHGEANKATIFFEKSAVAFLECLAMGFAWYIEAPAPVGVPEGQRSAIPTPHALGTGWVGWGCFGLGRAAEDGARRGTRGNGGADPPACPGGWRGRPGPVRGTGAPAAPSLRLRNLPRQRDRSNEWANGSTLESIAPATV
jgi:hypothetical protein